ncbi:MAG: hypothetical protein ACLPY5_03360 [Candidatus Bathyarchaeia archaeon]
MAKSANWSGWRYIGELLTQLGCPMEEFKFANVGDKVSEVTARLYGEAIRKAVEEHRVFDSIVPDDSYLYGFCEKPVVVADFEKENDEILKELDDETKEWLLDWSDFFLNSGGFTQW